MDRIFLIYCERTATIRETNKRYYKCLLDKYAQFLHIIILKEYIYNQVKLFFFKDNYDLLSLPVFSSNGSSVVQSYVPRSRSLTVVFQPIVSDRRLNAIPSGE